MFGFTLVFFHRVFLALDCFLKPIVVSPGLLDAACLESDLLLQLFAQDVSEGRRVGTAEVVHTHR